MGEFIPLYPLYALLFADSGLSTAQITSLLVIWSAVPLLLEVPSGALADLLPRRALLVVAAAIRAVGFALWVLAPGYLSFAAGFVCWGIGSSLESGTFESYCYDRLAVDGVTRRYRTLISAGRAGGLTLNLAATALAAPLLTAGGYLAAGAVSVGACLVQAVAAATLQPDRARSTDRRRAPTGGGAAEEAVDDDPGVWTVLRQGVAQARRAPSVRRALILVALVPVFGVLDEYFGLLGRDLHASDRVIPLLVATTVAAQALGALAGRRFPGRLVGPALAVAAGLIGAGALSGSPAGFTGIALGYGVLEMCLVVVETRLQDMIVGGVRATVTSLANMAGEVLNLAALGLIAAASGVVNVAGIVVALAIAMLPAAVLARRWTR